ncbi:MAG TPA: nucleotidyltransferase family protein [Pyrinomonadaceae bacterium]|nr:nucleotidyltransferase family protein [Pyrinomonadaceae bacterium]
MSTEEFTSAHGKLVASALAGAWRAQPPPCALTASDFEAITPLLLKSGTAALVWRRLHQERRQDGFMDQLHLAYKLQALQAAVHEHEVKEVFRLLHATGLDGLLVKGWAVARLYPERGLRHYGDIDLCVCARDFERAVSLGRGTKIWIDFHRGFSQLDGSNEEEIFGRSVLLPIDDVTIRTPSLEDHLRILCLHLLRHGAWQPLWLVDVALILETSTQDFDWQRFFGRNLRRAEWLSAVLLLAHTLLEANLEETPLALRTKQLPSWLVQSVLRRWGRWFNADYRNPALTSLWKHRGQPRKLFDDLYFRFDPIRATVETGGAFNSIPRLPYQLAAFLRRASEMPRRLANSLQD